MKRYKIRSIALPIFIALMVIPALQVKAEIVIDLTTSGTGEPATTGDALDNGTFLADLPLTVGVAETSGLNLIVLSGSSLADDSLSTVNGAGSSFGINSDGADETTRFDVDLEETMTIGFDQDVTILQVAFTNFSGTEEFVFGGITIEDGDAPSNVYTFASGGLELPANTGVSLAAGGPAGGNVGLVSITIAAVPEPGTLAILGMSGVMMMVRRRRA